MANHDEAIRKLTELVILGSSSADEASRLIRDALDGLMDPVAARYQEALNLRSQRIEELELQMAKQQDLAKRALDAMFEALSAHSIKPLRKFVSPPPPRRKAGRKPLHMDDARTTVEFLDPLIQECGSIRAGVLAMMNRIGWTLRSSPRYAKHDKELVQEMVEHYRTCKRRVARG